MTYLKNAWYVAAWSHEVADKPLARTILDIPVAVFRDEGGSLFAMHDRCPHRFAPLSMGGLVDGNVRCPYHGLSFNRQGQCVGTIFKAPVPKAATIRTFPVHEKDKAIWIWMGDPDLADPATIIDLPHHTNTDFECLFGVTLAKADYRLLSDNLMDLSHVAMVHPAFGGLDYQPKVTSREENGTVLAEFITEHMPDFTGSGQLIHNHDAIRWISPGNHVLDSRITLDDGRGRTITFPSAHLLTPETAKSTHYFWSSATERGEAVPQDMMLETLIQAFDREDKPMVEAVQQRMGDDDLFDLDPILLNADSGAVRVRRLLASQIAAEQGAAT